MESVFTVSSAGLDSTSTIFPFDSIFFSEMCIVEISTRNEFDPVPTYSISNKINHCVTIVSMQGVLIFCVSNLLDFKVKK